MVDEGLDGPAHPIRHPHLDVLASSLQCVEVIATVRGRVVVIELIACQLDIHGISLVLVTL